MKIEILNSNNIKTKIMKTLKLFFLVMSLSLTSLNFVNAGGNENYNQAYQQITDHIQALYDQIPQDQLNKYNDSPFLVLTFSVSKSHEMENLQVESSDDQLASYFKRALAKEKIKINPVFDGKKGQVPIQLPSKG